MKCHRWGCAAFRGTGAVETPAADERPFFLGGRAFGPCNDGVLRAAWGGDASETPFRKVHDAVDNNMGKPWFRVAPGQEPREPGLASCSRAPAWLR